MVPLELAVPVVLMVGNPQPAHTPTPRNCGSFQSAAQGSILGRRGCPEARPEVGVWAGWGLPSVIVQSCFFYPYRQLEDLRTNPGRLC